METKFTFKTREEYFAWIQEWKKEYERTSNDIRKTKHEIKNLSRKGESAGKLQKKLGFLKIAAFKLNTLRKDSKEAAQRAYKQEQSLKHLYDEFPIKINSKDIIFHFNRGHLQDPRIPMWAIKARGKTYYINHLDADIAWSTKETPDHATTKGSIRFRNACLEIDKKGHARIYQEVDG